MNWETIEGKVARSTDLTESEAKWLLDLKHPSDLKRLYAFADRVNERVNGRDVSFIHNMNVNYTNICEYHCTFCEFKRSPISKTAYIMTFDDIRRQIESADGELSEITYQGGLSPEVKFKEALGLLKQIHESFPEIHLHAFSPEEIDYYAWETGESYEAIVAQAKEAGMNSMCGTAAEVLDDEVRKKICSEKISADDWCTIIKTAHRLGMHSTATILFGHIETTDQVARHFRKIRDLQFTTGMITEFIPLLFMPDKTKLGRAVDKNLDRVEYAFKMIAAARLYFMNDIRNIQTSWVKLGWENAIRSLSFGANDMSGTLYHESITRDAGGTNGEYVPREKFIREISRIGKTPVERDTVYSYQKQQAHAARL